MDIDSNIVIMNQLENRYLFSQNKKHQTMNISKLQRKYGQQGNLIIRHNKRYIYNKFQKTIWLEHYPPKL